MKVYLYGRVSTTHHDQTVDTQLYSLREYCAAQGHEVVGEYTDEASAADLRGREGWRRLLHDVRIRKGGVQAVCVTKLDRAFRSSKDTYDTLADLKAKNVDFVAITQPVDTSTPAGNLILGVLAAVAEFERELIRERIREGLARARSNGKKLGRPKGSKDTRKRRRSGYFRRWAE